MSAKYKTSSPNQGHTYIILPNRIVNAFEHKIDPNVQQQSTRHASWQVIADGRTNNEKPGGEKNNRQGAYQPLSASLGVQHTVAVRHVIL
jgi:hypothetical protein